MQNRASSYNQRWLLWAHPDSLQRGWWNYCSSICQERPLGEMASGIAERVVNEVLKLDQGDLGSNEHSDMKLSAWPPSLNVTYFTGRVVMKIQRGKVTYNVLYLMNITKCTKTKVETPWLRYDLGVIPMATFPLFAVWTHHSWWPWKLLLARWAPSCFFTL